MSNFFTDKKVIFLTLLIIGVLASVLRLYQLSSVPPAISWDEAANGYNAWSIANYGIDEWGSKLPTYFKSFEDDKHPVHIYITALFVKVLGLSELSTRLPAALLGIANVILLFFLATKMFKNKTIGVISAFVLAISPYAIQFSRFSHELNFTIFFFLLGMFLFYKGLERKNFLLAGSFICFGIDLLTYHSTKVVVPPMVILLIILYFKELLAQKRNFLLGLFGFSFFVAVILFQPALLGLARINQTAISKSQIYNTEWYKKTNNEILGRSQIIVDQYLLHYSKQYLFETGDKNRRHSSQYVGEFYWIDGVLALIGLVYLLVKRSKVSLILGVWILLAPLPAALVQESPHASRAMFMMGSWHIVIACGFYYALELMRKRWVQMALGIVILSLMGWQLYAYQSRYFRDYAKDSATEWQYGMKQIASYVNKRPQYVQVFMTDERHQPYIFFLYYMQTNPNLFLKSRTINTEQSHIFSLVDNYDRFYFGNWDWIESSPHQGVLYVLTPSQYSGLKQRLGFQVKEKITYPDGGDAFYLVSFN